jgi:PAS domain S-box-containing protein
MGTDGADILDHVRESILVRDLGGRIISWNKASEELYGWPRAQAVGRLAQELLKTGYPEPVAVIEAKALETGRWEGELARVSAKGTEMTILAGWSVRRDPAGKPVDIVEIGRNISARKQAEAALRTSEHRYHTLFRAMAASFWELDFSGVDQMLRGLRKSGVQDFRKYLGDNPAFVREMMRATRVIEVNDQTVALFGRGDKEELLGNVEPFWPEESTQVYAEGILQGAAGKPHYSVECKLRRIDGSTFDALFTAAFPPEAMGKGTLVIGVIDITARKQAFAELEGSERRYRDLFHYMPMGLTQVDARNLIPLFKELRAQGVTDLKTYIDEHPEFLRRATDALAVEEVNEHNVRMFGAASAADMLGPITRYWQSGLDTIRRSIEARYRGEDFFQEETKLTTLDGRVIDVLFSTARPGAIADKSLVGFIDITARKQSEEALRTSEYRYRNMFRAMAASFWELDFSGANAMVRALLKSGVTDLRKHLTDNPAFVRELMHATRVVDVNDQTLALFGRGNKEELLGSVELFWPEESTHVYAESYLRAAERHPNYSAECKLRRIDGSTFDALFTVAYPLEALGKGLVMVGVIDTTDRVRAQEMLQRVQADFAHAARVSMLGELTASIAHEVNQPLAAIATNGEAGLRWLNRPVPDVAEVRELTKRVVADARRAGDIIARIRAMALRRAPEQALLSLDDVVREALLFLRHEIQSRAVTVLHHPAPAAPRVLADRTQLQQVIANLAVNAMQAMAQAGRADGRIIIRTDMADPATLRCTVEDNGPGVSPEHLTRLFESFFTTKESGMGMGLPICRSIIEAHGGRITADNQAANGGARFSFTLPVANPPT